jgi:HEAT repeat protein
MSVLHKLATALERNDEVPNQILAREIAEVGDKGAVKELVENLANPDKGLQSDCIKVLYEIGSLKPDLIADYVDDFLSLLRGRNNRLIWGAMTALGTVADRQAGEIWKHIDVVIEATDKGSVITQDWGIRVLASVAAKDEVYDKRLWPYLKTFLQNCPAKDLPRHAESVLPAISADNRDAYLHLLEARLPALKAASAKRVKQIIRKINAL